MSKLTIAAFAFILFLGATPATFGSAVPPTNDLPDGGATIGLLALGLAGLGLMARKRK